MLRLLVVSVGCTAFVSACTHLPEWAFIPILHGHKASDHSAQYSFDWALSGDSSVAPLQVFDNGSQTWLQFMPGQAAVPAVFASTTDGDRLLPGVRQGDYLRLDGVWPQLRFRGGGLQAHARRLDPVGDTESAVKRETPDRSAIQASSYHGPETVSLPVSAPTGTSVSPLASVHVLPTGSSSLSSPGDNKKSALADPGVPAGDAGFDSAVKAVGMDAASANASLQPDSSYHVTLGDKNLRQTLSRWARQANWTFAPEHWAVDVDIPVSGEAGFGGSFVDAVQDLLAATELAERPLQPCFYANRLLRVVPYLQACDRRPGVRAS